MATKNFTLEGLASVVNFGKGNATVVGASSTQLRARNNDNTADANMSGADPVAVNDFATKGYTDALVQGLDWRPVVRVASTANLNLAAMPSSVDGVTLSNGDAFLAKNQTVGVDNGWYIFNGAGAAATRRTGEGTGVDSSGFATFVEEGTVNAERGFVETATPGVIGTDALTLVQFTSAGGGVTNIVSVDNGGGAGTFASLVADGAAPTPDIRSIANGSQISAVVSGNEVDLAIVAASVGNTELAANAVEEDNLAAGVAVLFRRLQITAAGFPATTGSNTINLGDALPANAIVQGGIVLVTTAFDNSPDLQVGTATTPDAIFDTDEVDLTALGTCVSSKASAQSSAQLVVTRTTNAAQPTAGVAEVMANFVRAA
jgi:hypothetical protein